MSLTARLAASIERQSRARGMSVPPIWPAELNALYGVGTQVIDQPDTHAPKAGWAWDLYRVSVSGFTQGTVTLYRTAVQPQNTFLIWTQPGMYTLDKRQGLIMPGDRFVWQFTGVDHAYTAGSFVLIEIAELSDYLRA